MSLTAEDRFWSHVDKTSSPYGHPYDVTNTYVTKKGERTYRKCHRLTTRARRSGDMRPGAELFG